MTRPALSRQRQWQLARKSRGLCSECGSARLYRDEHCALHYLIRRLRRHGIRLAPALLTLVAAQLWNERNYWRRRFASEHLETCQK